MAPKYIVFGITGYGQTRRSNSGLEKLLIECYEKIPGVYPVLRNWNDSIKALANWVRRLADKWPTAKRVGVGYSYGGTSVIETCWDLCNRGVDVARLFLIDAVWRPFRRKPSLRSLGGNGELVVPGNVSYAKAWRQENTRIRGSRIVRESTIKTKLVEEVIPHLRHVEMDDCHSIHDEIIGALAV